MNKKYVIIDHFKNSNYYMRDDGRNGRTTFGERLALIISKYLTIELSPNNTVIVKQNKNLACDEYADLADPLLQKNMYCQRRGTIDEGVQYKILLEVNAETDEVLALHDRNFNQDDINAPLTRVALPAIQYINQTGSFNVSKDIFMDVLISHFLENVLRETKHPRPDVIYRAIDQNSFVFANAAEDEIPANPEKTASSFKGRLRSLFGREPKPVAEPNTEAKNQLKK